MILFKLPAHLERFENCAPESIAKTDHFCEMGAAWIDPVTETVFWANGCGQFESGEWRVNEHPDLPLTKFDEGEDFPLDANQFVRLVDDVKQMGHDSTFGFGRVLNALKSYGVKWTTVEEQLVKGEYPVRFFTGLSNFTSSVDQRARRRFGAMAEGHILAGQFVRPKGTEDGMTATDLRMKWDQCVEKLDAAGLDVHVLIIDLLKRICADLGCPVELNERSICYLVPAVDNEILVSGYVPPVEEDEPTAQIDIDSFATKFKSDSDSAKLVEDVKARRDARKKEREGADQQAPAEPGSEMQSEDPEVRLWFIHSIAADAGITKEEVKQIHESMTVNDLGMTFEVLDALHEAILELSEIRKNAQSSEAPDVAADTAKPKGKKGTKKESNVAELSVPSKELMYEKRVSNHTSGTNHTFAEVMTWIRNKQADAEYYEKEAKAARAAVAGYLFCYWSDIYEIVHQQFTRQHRGNGVFKPATVATKFGTFKRKAHPEPPIASCTNRAEFQSYLDELTPEEAELRGDGVKMVFVPNEDFIAAQVADGIAWPGWEKAPPSAEEQGVEVDIVGEVWLEGAKKIKQEEEEEPESKGKEDAA